VCGYVYVRVCVCMYVDLFSVCVCVHVAALNVCRERSADSGAKPLTRLAPSHLWFGAKTVSYWPCDVHTY
jgi:hypothetical protein